MISEVLQGLGGWSVTLREDTPRYIVNQLGYFGHIVLVQGVLDPAAYGDNLLATEARYVGILREKTIADQITLSGCGMEGWLADEDDKGDIQASRAYASQSFVNAITNTLPAAVHVGNIYAQTGTYTETHSYQSPRTIIKRICEYFNCYYRVRGDAKIDAGTAAELFVSTPTCVIVRKNAGVDLTMTAIQGNLSVEQGVNDFTTKVLLVNDDNGTITSSGSATLGVVPYTDFWGNAVVRTRLSTESGNTTATANSRAQLLLNRFTNPKKSVSLSSNEYEVEGNFRVGDNVYVHDVATGMYDLTKQVQFRGQVLNPQTIRATATSWPVSDAYTVGFRTTAGTWLDLTRYVNFESGQTTITVGDLPPTLNTFG